jgi:capsular polysaccharide export protein
MSKPKGLVVDGSDRPVPDTALPAGLRLVPMGGKLAAMPGLRAFLPEGVRLCPLPFGLIGADALLGWGRKGSGARAQRLGRLLRKPVVTLEDGFVRSFGLGVAGAPALSAVVDDLGVHYDARAPSRIEAMLEHGGWEGEALLARARACVAKMRRLRISKYNLAQAPSPATAALLGGERFVLCVDQTAGDASVALGRAGPDSFRRMVQAARAENPGARILVKTHPDVAAGLRQGLVDPADAAAADAVVIGEALDPWLLLEGARSVYTVTSQMGLEALVAGLPVRCFGLPFHAGWGATVDELSCPRRTRRRSATEIIAAAYLLYARYADPTTGDPTTLEATIATIAARRAAGG